MEEEERSVGPPEVKQPEHNPDFDTHTHIPGIRMTPMLNATSELLCRQVEKEVVVRKRS